MTQNTMADDRSAANALRLPSHTTTPDITDHPPQNGALAPPATIGVKLGGPANRALNGIKGVSRTSSNDSGHLSIAGTLGHHDLLQESGSGYVAPKFEGKEAQMDQVMDLIEEKGFIPADFVEAETRWFYEELGIDDMYFQAERPEVIVNHILSLYAGKVGAYARDDKRLEIRLDKEAGDHAVYIDTSHPGVSNLQGPQYEKRIDQKWLNTSTNSDSYRVESFRSESKLPGESDQKLRCYFVYKCHFQKPNPRSGESDIEKLGDSRFLLKATENTRAVYQEVMNYAVNRTGPVIDIFNVQGSREKRLVIAYKQGTALGLYSALSDLYHYYGLTSTRKYVEQFSNGITILSVYLRAVEPNSNKHPPIEASIHQIVKEVSLLYCIPQNRFQSHFASGTLTLQETIYAHCAWIFASNFMNRLGSSYTTLTSILDPNNTAHAEVIAKIKRRLRAETFTSDYILDIINRYPDVIHALYVSFAHTHYVQQKGQNEDFLPTLSYLRLKIDRALSHDELEALINKTVVNDHDSMVLGSMLTFNNAILKTNFFTPTKVALSFRLKTDFLPADEYPQPLYGMFMVVSSESRGFHLRFRDVARGGIRIVRSRDREAYAINARSMFDENYNLANTQNRKNKDIPEGGSKGVVLLDYKHQDKVRLAFEKYIDAILDLLLPPTSPGIKDPIVDLYGKEEILFMGPDENSADLVDWATLHARERGAPFWKSFFTGKSTTLGGIPHDRYGMTTRSVRQYVEGIYRKLDLDPSTIRKLQTGGPDGDLGSNEILLGNEKYCAVTDGSGVLCDPAGLNMDELKRLAMGRKMIQDYDISLLSEKGYRVLLDDKDVTLPSGEVIGNGMALRNNFFVREGNDFDSFVPCGGRPESISMGNVQKLIVNGKTTIPYIVEGANLFITQDARLRLEKAGCIIYKDASANKGGVTSSSLEVLASLAFDDDGFLQHMCSRSDGTIPDFYQAYVKQVQSTIENNARLEFEAIWREHEKTAIPRSVLSDQLSNAIVKLDSELQNSSLWDNVELRTSILNDALPRLLVDKIGLDRVIERVPDSYLRAIFGSYLASRFIYEHGSSPGQFAFFDFMSKRIANLDTGA